KQDKSESRSILLKLLTLRLNQAFYFQYLDAIDDDTFIDTTRKILIHSKKNKESKYFKKQITLLADYLKQKKKAIQSASKRADKKGQNQDIYQIKLTLEAFN